MRLTVKLVLTPDPSPTGTLTLTRPPRKARYTLNETTGRGVYSGPEEKTGKTVRVTIDEDTRTLTLLEQDQPPRTLTVDPEHWHLNHTKGAKHLRFGAGAAGLTLKGALRLGKDGRVGDHLKLREGEWQKSHYALTTRLTPSGPAGLFYIHTDHLGTPQVLSDDNQAIVWQADYMPFGEATLTKDHVTFNLRFPGQYFDSETGLHQNWHRDYDPAIGRYLQSDPIGLRGGLNTYAYVKNSPIMWADPMGLSAEMCTRPLLIAPWSAMRHCFLRFNGDNNDTSSFDPEGVHPDPKPEWGSCEDVRDDDEDDCLRREMAKCQAEQYDFTGNNCCHCVESALRACGQSVPRDSWPNWPINPGPQPGEPGYQP